MLEALGSAVRSFRTTIVAGALWLAALFVALHPYEDDPGPGLRSIDESFDAMRSAAPDVVALLGLALAAYVLGVVSEALCGSAARILSRTILLAQRKSTSNPLKRLDEIGTLDGFLETAHGRSAQRFAGRREDVRAARLRLELDAPTLARRVFALYDEAGFRLQLLAPLLGLAIGVGIHAPWGWRCVVALLALGVVLSVGASANHCAERANDLLADWVGAGEPSQPADDVATAP